jgi:hypothetical protein
VRNTSFAGRTMVRYFRSSALRSCRTHSPKR